MLLTDFNLHATVPSHCRLIEDTGMEENSALRPKMRPLTLAPKMTVNSGPHETPSLIEVWPRGR